MGSTISTTGQRWQSVLADAVRDPAKLLTLLDLPTSLLPAARQAAQQFPLKVPRGFLARMRCGDPDDPLLRQVLPLAAELKIDDPSYTNDPVGDLQARTEPGLLQKYAGRALLVTTGACAVHCRYCFRRHFPYQQESAASDQARSALARVAEDTSISELILSGGDPLSLANRRLQQLTRKIETIPHLRRLRLHTRLPVMVPERVDAGLLDWLDGLQLPVVLVLHVNHANEIDEHVATALAPLRSRPITLLNQAVLLRGVNDSVDALAALSERLLAVGVLPYYLHALDPVRGAAHFAVPDTTARDLGRALRARLPGYLVPTLVREIPGAMAKTPL